MNVQKQTSIIAAVLFIFMLILAACPSAFVYIPNKDDRIPPNAFDNNVERAKKPQWFVRKLGSNDPWGSPGTSIKVSFPHDVELIARSDTPGAVIHYESGESFAKIPPFSNKSENSATRNEDNPLTLSGSFSTRAYSAAVEAPLIHPSGNSYLIVTLYPDRAPTPLFDTSPGNYDQQSLKILFTTPGSGIYYNIVISPEDTNKNGKLDPEEFITPSGNDDNVTINVSDPDPENFPKIDDDPLSGVIDSSFEPDGGYQKYADNPIPTLIRGQTACIKAYSAPEKYRPSYRPPLEEDGSPTGILQGCFSVDAAVPAAPAAPTLTVGDTQLTATWTTPNNNGGSPITGYELQYKVSTATSWTLITSGITGASHTITELTNGTSYDVRVRAVNGAGNGQWSTPTTGMPSIPFATQVPKGTDATVILSAKINNIITAQNPIVSLTTVEQDTLVVSASGVITVTAATAPAGVSIPTVNANTGVVTVAAADTTAGTYVVYGSVTETGEILFAEYFYVTVSPQPVTGTAGSLDTDCDGMVDGDDDSTKTDDGGRCKLITDVIEGINNWGDTADLNYIITTAVTDMRGMFQYASAFNGDISRWDVSSVMNMSDMFEQASVFNGDISGWDVSKVTNMSDMFNYASAFNGDISDWDVSSVMNMSYMFDQASLFNGDISRWNVSKVTNMIAMFRGADTFNGDISDWIVSKVTNMSGMFRGASAFTGDISDWIVSSVTTMSHMFQSADAFNGDISDWNVSSVTDMQSMFQSADAFNGDISGWDVSSVTNMLQMFYFANAFNRDLEEWNEHWTLNSAGEYTGIKSNMFNGSGVTTPPSWY